MHNESSVMENKNSRASGPSEVKSSKLGTDGGGTGRPVARTVKKRDGVSTSFTGSWGSTGASGGNLGGNKSSKNPSPKFKGQDKRPTRCRTTFGGMGASIKDGGQVADGANDLELDYLLPDHGKKNNLAHLLNMKFQLTPRESVTSSYWRATHATGEPKRLYHKSYSGRGYLSKDHYLQANCQFVVKAGEDYTAYLSDPDLMVPWESVEQIRVWGSEVGSCPICLHSPSAARMTRCGHIYCWPCILHFLALSDKPSRPCPICDAPVRITELRSVVTLEQKQFKIGDSIKMRLMKRHRHSLVPQVVSKLDVLSTARQPTEPVYLSRRGEEQLFSKLLLCTPEDVVDSILLFEKAELETQLELEKDCPESCFIQQALGLLAMRESALNLGTGSLLHKDLTALNLEEDRTAAADGAPEKRTASPCTTTVGSPPDHFLDYQASSGESFPLDSSSDFLSCATMCNVNPTHQPYKNVFYFYQSCDGQAIYLHPVNVQMLVRCYGSLEFCPEAIEGRIVETEAMSMTEDLRNRLRYLGHVPISKQFHVVEISLTDTFVHAAVLEEFQDRIDDRDRRRRRKIRKERRRDLEIQQAEEAKWGRSKKQPAVRLDSQEHFPGFSPTDVDPPLCSPTQSDQFLRQTISPCLEHSPEQLAGPSFAQMLREGKQRVTDRSAPVSLPRNLPTSEPCHSDEDDFTAVPEYRDTFNSVLAAALDQAVKKSGGAGVPSGQVHRKASKKKTKQKVLFSTGINFM